MAVRRKLKRRLPFLLFVGACLVLLSGALLVAGELWQKLSPGSEKAAPESAEAAGGSLNSFTILLLGVDARPGEEVARTDTIIVAHVEAAEKRLSLLSIPRDTRVYIPGYGMDKINAANVYGGPELVRKVVSDLVGMPVKYYALTNLEGFREIVDTLGGVTLEVDKRMYYYDPVDGPEYAIDLQPGVQRLDGKKALQYVRYRNDPLGDITRTERQLKFLKALAAEVMQADTLLKLPRLVPQISRSLDTNLGLRQMVTLAQVAKNFNQMEILTQTLPGHFLQLEGASYWAVDSQQARKVAYSLFKDGLVVKVVDGPTEEVPPPKALAMNPADKTEEKKEEKTSAKENVEGTGARPSVPGAGGGTGEADTKPAQSGTQKDSQNRPGTGTGKKTGDGNLGVIPGVKENPQRAGGNTKEEPVQETTDQKTSGKTFSVEIRLQ
ncbi:MAG: LCP family protein [Firmicutes bacterium]|nr:LCP family protein [Bacillota bacterium]